MRTKKKKKKKKKKNQSTPPSLWGHQSIHIITSKTDKKLHAPTASSWNWIKVIPSSSPRNYKQLTCDYTRTSEWLLARVENGKELRKRTHQWTTTNRKTKHIRQFRQLNVFIGKKINKLKAFLNIAWRNLREVPSATSPSFEKLREAFYRQDSFADFVLRSLREVVEAD